MSDADGSGCRVLVTGGAGFLGQHVVGLLQTRADHVTDIVVLDVEPYVNKLDYVHTKPLRSFVGSITDEAALRQACRGVHSVIHIAGVADPSMFPDKKRIMEVNVQGTLMTVLASLNTPTVKRLVFCSSTSVGIGYDSDVTSAISETDPVPAQFIFEPYGSSKLSGERIALSANSDLFRVVRIRPLVMYGELDTGFVAQGQAMARKTGGTLVAVNCSGIKQHQAYVGNVAWGFVCAEIKLHKERTTRLGKVREIEPGKDDDFVKKLCSHIRRRSERLHDDGTVNEDQDHTEARSRLNAASDSDFSEHVYYVADDTPPADPFEFQTPFLKDTGYNVSSFRLPIVVVLVLFFIMHWVLKFIRLVGISRKANYPVSSDAVKFLRKSYIFDDSKARRELNYTPIYSPSQAYERSVEYYKQNSFR